MAWLLLRLAIGFGGAWLLIAGLATLVESNELGFMAALTGAGLLLAAVVGPRLSARPGHR